MRLDRFLCDMNKGSRKTVKELIRSGRVFVNGQKLCKNDAKVDPSLDEIFLDGERIVYKPFHYYMLNKPAGYVSSTEREPAGPYRKEEGCKDRGDEGGSKTVTELFEKEGIKGLKPAGRLDKDTEGLLIVSDDGELIHRVISPKKHVSKVYEVKMLRMPTEEELCLLRKGVDIGDDKPALPARVIRCFTDDKGVPVMELSIYEGRYHQVKRMLQAIDNKVIHLKRLSIGEVSLDPSLRPGEYRALKEEELKSFY